MAPGLLRVRRGDRNTVTRTIALVAVLAAPLAAHMFAADVVQIRLAGHYFSEPATVDITVLVEPDPANRVLRVEADGDQMYRSTEFELRGGTDSRVHMVEFKDLEAGNYVLRAQVLGTDKVRGTATSELMVTGR
jgi:hypothetical protein